MSKCIYKEIADKLNKDELEKYYETHLPKDVAKHFGFDQCYFRRIFDYLGIPRSVSHNSKVQMKYYLTDETRKKFGAHAKGKHRPEDIKLKISTANKKPHNTHTSSEFKKGNIPWNKGMKGLTHWSEKQREKYFKTISDNNWYKKSKVEDTYYQKLLDSYDQEDIIRQYSDERYPYRCDFYIRSEDKFIELNRWWHHGPHPFDENNIEDLKLLSYWKERSLTNKQFENAIQTWTIRDVEKINTARKNNLNYELIY